MPQGGWVPPTADPLWGGLGRTEPSGFAESDTQLRLEFWCHTVGEYLLPQTLYGRGVERRLERSGVESSGVEWSGVEWSGVEWSGVGGELPS